MSPEAFFRALFPGLFCFPIAFEYPQKHFLSFGQVVDHIQQPRAHIRCGRLLLQNKTNVSRMFIPEDHDQTNKPFRPPSISLKKIFSIAADQSNCKPKPKPFQKKNNQSGMRVVRLRLRAHQSNSGRLQSTKKNIRQKIDTR